LLLFGGHNWLYIKLINIYLFVNIRMENNIYESTESKQTHRI